MRYGRSIRALFLLQGCPRELRDNPALGWSYLADPEDAAACSMRAATGAGCDSMATWLEGRVMVSA
jgi:hypothetical protein